MKSRRAVLVEPGRFEIQTVDVAPAPDEVLVHVDGCGLCNWELNFWKGILGPLPLALGHEWAGTIVESGANVTGFAAGDRVTSLSGGMNGFSDYLTAPAAHCFKLGDGVDPVTALGEPLKCIITVLRAASPEPGDYAVVLGCGPMGLWCIQALSGCPLGAVIAIDADDERLKVARLHGATHLIDPRTEAAEVQVSRFTGGRLADFVIEGTGVPAVMNDALRLIRKSGRGRLLLMSSHEGSCGDLDLREAIARSVEIRVPHPQYSVDPHDDLRRAILLLNAGTLRTADIVTHRFALDEIDAAFRALESKPAGYLKGVVTP